MAKTSQLIIEINPRPFVAWFGAVGVIAAYGLIWLGAPSKWFWDCRLKDRG